MLKQGLNQKLLQKLSPQQIQLMKLIQLPLPMLEERIKQEIEENPALEEVKKDEEYVDDEAFVIESEEDEYNEDGVLVDEPEITSIEDFEEYDALLSDETPDYKLKSNNYSPDDEEYSIPVVSTVTFFENLTHQLGMLKLSEKQRQIGEYIIGNLDDDGYLRRDLESISNDLLFTKNISATVDEIEDVLRKIQDLDPPGIGARDLRECLLIQLAKRPQTPVVKLASRILENYFEEFAKKHYEKLMDRLDLNEDTMRDVIEEISKLNPKPGLQINTAFDRDYSIIPDFIININNDQLELTLNERNAPELNISREYKELLQAYKEGAKTNKSQKEALLFVKQKLDSAKWFIEAIQQRQQTLLITMSAIMNFQKEFFLTGDWTKLKPMILKDIADEVGLDISTISRVASNKYVQTPFGTFLLKELFSEGMTTTDGEEVSTKEIKKILELAIAEEDKSKPYTDDQLCKILNEKGYPLARRTVAKYREQLGIPVARLRKELKK
ncbi:MAG: RNA polymerase factor sigma-54 [Thermaurantimonas sp.]|uniref:RNA polymerase factor sigma-54 n=1 Tax=Thermaurantimonas sp. TaxID=2681568 RepID=UPI00391A7E3E